ncbi:hypothetical protein COMNV_00196 [Commensalibacter sp. Nvir]|uniref:lysophospholipid acyltransferase family protein n=1 Tax=Commensalibacter sp. Nvir TaxID=3069817 RepID=UPI002D68F903|nr:hypothetical protein COMNV_00196 [Commensalibacter sp. Nvir]
MVIIRSTAFAIYFFLLTLIMGVLAFPLRFFAKQHALAYAKYWAHLTLLGLEKICHISLQLHGQEHLLNDRPFIIASQHQSAYDTLVWMNLLKRPAYVMKQELTRIPLVGPMLLLSGMIPLDRKGGIKALKHLTQQCRNAINDSRQIIIFPEGTRTKIGQKVKLHSGAVAVASQLKLPITPVSTNSGIYWPKRSFLKYPGTIHIIVHKPSFTVENRKHVMQYIEDCWSKF